MRQRKYTGWERLVLMKTEDELTGENFSKLLKVTYALVKDFSGGDILIGLMIHSDRWDHQCIMDGRAQCIIDTLSVFITKMNPEEGKDFDTFNGFSAYDYGDEIPLTETFPNRL